ncbi:mucin-2-like isoform X1 [Hetaerina americana]|uniref:mucin-2-like isoform X1 n=1 Tax=Hetaerina americana TaxID=62018 RepID=UPI003A7F4736
MNDKGRMPYPPQTQPPPYAPPAPQAYPEPAPQPYGFTANPPPTTSTVTVIQVPTGTILGPMSTCVTCPSCHAVVHTRVDHEPSSRTHMFAVLLCIFGHFLTPSSLLQPMTACGRAAYSRTAWTPARTACTTAPPAVPTSARTKTSRPISFDRQGGSEKRFGRKVTRK